MAGRLRDESKDIAANDRERASKEASERASKGGSERERAQTQETET